MNVVLIQMIKAKREGKKNVKQQPSTQDLQKVLIEMLREKEETRK
jgi:hypothetical protein